MILLLVLGAAAIYILLWLASTDPFLDDLYDEDGES